MTVVSKPVPTFKPHWLRKDNPARGRRPKTPRTDFERKWHDFHTELHDPAPLGYRRQPKGRRAKSGQWWRREPSPVLLGPDVCETMRVFGWNHAWGVDYADPPARVIIDEAADPIPMDVLQRCDPRMAGGRVAWVGVDFAKDGSEQTVYRMPDGTIRVEPSRSNKP